MKVGTWLKFTPRQQHVLLVAIYVRDALEDFHTEHINDAQMKELNMIIRQSLYDIVSIIEDDDRNQKILSYLVAQIPDYWEVPADGYSITSQAHQSEDREAA